MNESNNQYRYQSKLSPAAQPREVSIIGPLQLRVMFVLWRMPAIDTVHQVHVHLNGEKGAQELAYTTYLTVMRNLARRGFVTQIKGEGNRHHTFKPALTEKEYVTDLLTNIRDTVFGGSQNVFFAAVAAL